MTFRKFRYYLYIGSAIGGSMALAAYIVWYLLAPKPPGKRVLKVEATAEYQEATRAAMDLWNGYIGCEFLVMGGDDISVRGDDGEPCGDPWRPADEYLHAATAYRCGEKAEILVSFPGDLHQQAAIIGHEIGHTLQARHASRGIMSSYNPSQEMLRILDEDVDRARERFCNE